METIPILTVIDCQSVIKAKGTGGTASNPINLGAWGTSDLYVYMITTESFVVSAQAKSELTVKAQVGQNIQWAITCIGAGTQYNAILQSIRPSNTNVMPSPMSLPLTVDLYVGAPGATPTPNQFNDYVLQGTVLNVKASSIQYSVTFSIVDTSGKTLGFYTWDPFINITN